MTPETEAFLASVRDAEAPSAEAQRRVLDAVHAAVAPPPVAAATVLSAKTALKLALCVAGITAATTFAVQPSAPHTPNGAAPPPQPTAAGRTSGPPAPRAPLPLTPPTPVAPARKPANLQAELAFLAEIHALLRRGEGAEAVRRLDAHRTTDRQLLAERRAARVFALCAAGRAADAQLAAAAFVRRHPTAPQREAVERACAAPAR